MRILITAVAALTCLMALPIPAESEDYGATARGMFAMLPTSIFENTAEGLSGHEKQRLLLDGQSEFWEIAGEDSDVLVLAALPLRDRAVALRIFRNSGDGSTLAAIGSLGSPICVLELWRLDESGRLVPVAGPDEPDIREFLAAGQKLPRGVNPSVFICLGLGGLGSHPIFWRGDSLVDVPLANDINFVWTGTSFEKQISPRNRPTDPSAH